MSQDDEKPKRGKKKRKTAETTTEEVLETTEANDDSLPILPPMGLLCVLHAEYLLLTRIV